MSIRREYIAPSRDDIRADIVRAGWEIGWSPAHLEAEFVSRFGQSMLEANAASLKRFAEHVKGQRLVGSSVARRKGTP